MNFFRTHKRWFIGGFVVFVLALLIWFLAPLLGSDESRPLAPWSVRLLLIILVVALWLGLEFLLRWLAARRNRKLMDEMAAGAADDSASREEQAALQQRFAEALKTLKGTRLGGKGGGKGGAKLLYQLPWYMFIGAPGSGKTTALVNSGLRFPLAAPGAAAAALGGIGGTRNCDWWFTNQAVLIDTAGRYTTQDSQAQVDESAWKSFLALLKKYRPRQPINGVIVTLSMADLLQGTAAERNTYAQTVRVRIEELQRDLGLQFPVYLMVTKSDLISGFSEFFANLDAEGRAQVWGNTFELDLKSRATTPAKAGFDAAFPGLVERINQQLLPRLQEERDADRRAALYAFPQQFAAVGPLVSSFLETAFGESKLAQPALLRGVYFSSGTQFGTPVDRVIQGLAQALDLQGGTLLRAAGTGGAAKSYFLQRLLTEVVFGEAGLAGHSERREQQLKRLSWAVIGLSLLVGLGLITAWTLSFFNNRAGLQQAASAANTARQSLAAVGAPAAGDLASLVQALDDMRTVPPAVHDPVDQPRGGMRWGLYQGRAVDEQVQERYRAALQRGLIPRIALQLETVMAAPQASPDAVYAALKTYLMLFDAKRMNADWFVGAVGDLWRGAFDPALVGRALPHLHALAAAGELQADAVHTRNAQLVSDARTRVASSSLVDRAYAMLRLSGAGEGIRLSEVLGASGVGVLERASGTALTEPIPAVFTVEGYLRNVKPRIAEVAKLMGEEEAWVMGSQASGVGSRDPAQVAAEVQRRYFADYEQTWRGVLADIRLRRLDGLRGALNASQVLSTSDSALKRLIQVVVDQTRLANPGTVGDVASKAAEEEARRKATQKAATATSGLFGTQAAQVVGAALPKDSSRQLEQQLEERFSDLRRLLGDGKGGEIDAAIALINEVASELVALQQKLSSGQGVREMPARLLNAKAQADRFALPISGVIKGLVAVAEGEAGGGIKQEIKAGVGGAAAMCKRAIPGKYPFNRNSANDVGVQDFVNVFKAGGELDSFFTSTLASFVDKSGAVWRLKATGEGSPPVSAGTLRQFQNAEAIRTAFLGGGANAQVVVDLSVASSDGELQLDYDGASHKLKTGGSARLNWPARPGAKLTIGGAPVLQVEGAWALFRLVDKGQLDAASAGDRLRLGYTAGNGQKATIELRVGSAAFNPFRLRELDSFACPQE